LNCIDGDTLNPPAKRDDIASLLLASNTTYQINLYSHVGHGFAVRANASVPAAVYAKDDAFFQAVKWFTTWA
jgi:dienelactone hydrolase